LASAWWRHPLYQQGATAVQTRGHKHLSKRLSGPAPFLRLLSQCAAHRGSSQQHSVIMCRKRAAVAVPSSPTTSESPSPFPAGAIAALALALLSHGYALTSLFPYVGYLVLHVGATTNKVQTLIMILQSVPFFLKLFACFLRTVET
jgi:hypothetical protein